MSDSETEDGLMRLAAAGDRDAFDKLVRLYGPAVHRLARAMVSSETAAEDVLQETFLAAFRAAGTYRSDVASVRTWLFAIARNCARRTRRHEREVPAAEIEFIALGIDAGWGVELPEIELRERGDILARALATLTSDDREIIVLRDIEAITGEETSTLLGIGLPATKSRLHRARLRLLAALREVEGGIVANERNIGGLSCSAVLAQLGSYVDRELAPAETQRMDEHLRGCDVCERFGGRYIHLVHTIRAELGAPLAWDEAQIEHIRTLLSQR